jgi:hypothetical protein
MKNSKQNVDIEDFIQKNKKNGFLIEPYSFSWLSERLDKLVSQEIAKSKNIKNNSSNYILFYLDQNFKKYIKELSNFYQPLSEYFNSINKDGPNDLFKFLLINLQTKQLLVIRIDQNLNYIETDVIFDTKLRESCNQDDFESIEPPNYDDFLKDDYLGVVGEFINSVAMVAKLTSIRKNSTSLLPSSDQNRFESLAEKLDKVNKLSHAIEKNVLDDINKRVNEIVKMSELFRALYSLVVRYEDIDKKVERLCKKMSVEDALSVSLGRLQIFFPAIGKI